ncbi:PLP-dependent aminotransferase family protein [Streptomyces longwoodensis]|uniref:aminotransferase-like domain-containing protein n=1 Tax=Streptomyces longwoodensis TaxID=68231 RepID=UPI003405E9D9
MESYRRIVERIAGDIRDGRLLPGQQLPPQRVFARRHRIAPSTAGRVYGELVRRGLVVGEVGRGTFVRAAPEAPAGRALVEGGGPRDVVNLELNYPSVPGQSELLAPALAPLLRPDVLTEALRPAPATGTRAAREAVAALLAVPGAGAGGGAGGGACSSPDAGRRVRSGPEPGGGACASPGAVPGVCSCPDAGRGARPAPGGWRPRPGHVVFTGNARQAIAAALGSLVPAGGRVGVDELTYPLVKEIAGRLGVRLVPVAGDEEGMRPDALAAAHRSGALSALYLQPALHNPTSRATGERRLAGLAAVIGDLGLPVVEDRIWSFLRPGAVPLAAHLPGLAHVVDGLSKRVAPGLTVGFLVVPPERVETVAAAVRSGGWSAGRFALEAAVRWLGDGTVERLVAAKREDARRRQELVREHLDGLRVRSDPGAYVAWWELPAPWRADTFTAAAAAAGIAVTPGTAFAVDPHRTPDAVRLGLASAPPRALARALRTLAAVARAGPPGG